MHLDLYKIQKIGIDSDVLYEQLDCLHNLLYAKLILLQTSEIKNLKSGTTSVAGGSQIYHVPVHSNSEQGVRCSKEAGRFSTSCC